MVVRKRPAVTWRAAARGEGSEEHRRRAGDRVRDGEEQTSHGVAMRACTLPARSSYVVAQPAAGPRGHSRRRRTAVPRDAIGAREANLGGHVYRTDEGAALELGGELCDDGNHRLAVRSGGRLELDEARPRRRHHQRVEIPRVKDHGGRRATSGPGGHRGVPAPAASRYQQARHQCRRCPALHANPPSPTAEVVTCDAGDKNIRHRRGRTGVGYRQSSKAESTMSAKGCCLPSSGRSRLRHPRPGQAPDTFRANPGRMMVLPCAFIP